MAAELIVLINSPIPFAQSQLHIGASLDIAMYPANGQDGSTLQRRADRAMYDAKHAGKNQYALSQVTAETNELAANASPLSPRVDEAPGIVNAIRDAR